MSDDPNAEQSLEFAAKRAEHAAKVIIEMLKASDVPAVHWPEVVERLRDIVAAELKARGLPSD